MTGFNIFKTQQKPAQPLVVVEPRKQFISEHPITTKKYGYQWTRDVYANGAQPGFLKKVAAHQGVALTMTIANIVEFVMNGVFATGNVALALIGCALSGARNAGLSALGKKHTVSTFLAKWSNAEDVGKRLAGMMANVVGIAVSAGLLFGRRDGALATAERWNLKNPEPVVVKAPVSFYQQHKKKIYTMGVTTLAAAGAYVYRDSLPTLSMPSISMPSFEWPSLGSSEQKIEQPGSSSVQGNLDEAARKQLTK